MQDLEQQVFASSIGDVLHSFIVIWSVCVDLQKKKLEISNNFLLKNTVSLLRHNLGKLTQTLFKILLHYGLCHDGVPKWTYSNHTEGRAILTQFSRNLELAGFILHPSNSQNAFKQHIKPEKSTDLDGSTKRAAKQHERFGGWFWNWHTDPTGHCAVWMCWVTKPVRLDFQWISSEEVVGFCKILIERAGSIVPFLVSNWLDDLSKP